MGEVFKRGDRVTILNTSFRPAAYAVVVGETQPEGEVRVYVQPTQRLSDGDESYEPDEGILWAPPGRLRLHLEEEVPIARRRVYSAPIARGGALSDLGGHYRFALDHEAHIQHLVVNADGEVVLDTLTATLPVKGTEAEVLAALGCDPDGYALVSS